MYRFPPPCGSLSAIAAYAALSTTLLIWSSTCNADESKAKSDAVGKEPATRLTTPAVPSGNSAARTESKEEDATRKLKRRAGEQVGSDARGRALMLGMALQEGENGRPKVVEVSRISPAFAAGVKEGDEIVAFHGFTADSYRKWIDGVRRITTDSADGTLMSIVVSRNGKRVPLEILNPVTVERTATPRPLAQPLNPIAPPTPGVVPVPVGPGAVPAGGNNNVVVNNAGPFGAFFGQESEAVNERAIAHINRLNAPPNTVADPGVPASTPAAPNTGTAAAPANGALRIGLAGFRDDPSGMVVMVDVGALPAGNYTVGISDASSIGGLTATGTGSPNVQAANQDAPLVPLPAPVDDRRIQPQGGTAAPPAAPTRPVAPGANQPQGSIPPTLRGEIPRGVLAQVTESDPEAQNATTIPPSGLAAPSTIPPTGQVRPLTTPPTGNVNPSSTTPTGQSAVNNAQRKQGQAATGAGQTNTGTTLNEIGTITVDQSGTGRMQQTVEGVKVRNVVGQAIVIYAQAGSQQTTVPANLNGTAGASATQGATDTTSPRGSQVVADGGQGAAAAQGAVAGQAADGTRTPVAAGIIRMISDRRPPTAETDTAVAPSETTPAAGQSRIR